MRFRSALQIVALVILAAACVAPTRTEAAYQAKAADTAEAVVSAARTVLLIGRVAAADRSFGPSVAVTVADAETDAASARDAFASIQPPDPSVRRDQAGPPARSTACRRRDRARPDRGAPRSARPAPGDRLATRADRRTARTLRDEVRVIPA